MKKILFTFLLASMGTIAFAQDFKYQAVNPAFGGDTFNYNWLLSQAQAQNDYSEDPNADPFNGDPLADFQNDLNRQILSQLSRSLVGDLFGEDGTLNEGTYEIGNYQIEIINGLDGVNIGIFDTATGGTTTVTVPVF
jgi:curli production assembly/transport component CsgF